MRVAPRHRFLSAVLVSLGTLTATLGADEPKHLAITGSQRFRITYDSTFTWPGGSGQSAIMYLPVPPETGGQHIESFSSSLKGQSETDANGHRLIVATIHPGGERRVALARGNHRHVPHAATGGRFAGGQGNRRPRRGRVPRVDRVDQLEGFAFPGLARFRRLRRHAGESAAAFGARIYSYFREHGNYEYPPSSAWTASACCRGLSTDCGGFLTRLHGGLSRGITSPRACWSANASRRAAPAMAKPS